MHQMLDMRGSSRACSLSTSSLEMPVIAYFFPPPNVLSNAVSAASVRVVKKKKKKNTKHSWPSVAWETAPYYCDGLVPLLISGLLLLNVPKLQSSCHTTWLCCFLCLMLLPYKQDGYYHLSRGREAMQGFCVCMYMCVSVCAHMRAYGHQKQKSQGIKTGRGSKINKYKKYNLVFCICPWISLYFFCLKFPSI